MAQGNSDIIKSVEKDIEELSKPVFEIKLTKDEVLDLIVILSKEYDNTGHLLAKFADIAKSASE